MNEPEDLPDEAEIDVSDLKRINRDRLMEMASEVIGLLHRRTTSRRFKASQHDRERLQYARACTAAITGYTALLRDADLEDLAARIDELEDNRRDGR